MKSLGHPFSFLLLASVVGCLTDVNTLLAREIRLEPVVSSVLVEGQLSEDSGLSQEQWIEVKNSNQQYSKNRDRVGKKADVGDGQGDKLYMVERGDSLESIAYQHTGHQGNARTIATYNAIAETAVLQDGQTLIIPEALLVLQPAATSTDRQQYDSQIRLLNGSQQLLDTPSSQGRESHVNKNMMSVARSPAIETIEVATKNVDMFVGQVSVFGKVAVERVAVGRGSIVRAEVLDTGELLVIAQAEGSTSLRLWHKNGLQSDFNIRVSLSDPETRFHMEKMITLKVKMVEFRKSALGRLGIEWGDSAVGPTFATAGDFVTNSLYKPAGEGFAASLSGAVKPFSSYFGIASSLASKINFLSTSGDAVVLAEPTLSCVNGGSARFLAGGEVPYPTVQANGQTSVEFKEYGIRLEVAPKIDTAGNIQTAVLTEISSIDPSVSVQGAPGLLTRRTQTQVNVRTGETIVIAGLLKAENSKDVDKVPGIGNLPILGRLFKSENLRKDISELVIFITPEVMLPDSGLLNSRQSTINLDSDRVLRDSTGKLNLQLLE